MICKYCKTVNNNKNNYCFTCGKNITKSLNKNSEDYLSFFIDDNIKPHKPNLYAFIFGGCYLIYQKLYFYAYIIIFTKIILFLINPKLLVLSIFINLIISFTINNIIIDNSLDIINSIKSRNIQHSKIKEECIKRGNKDIIIPTTTFVSIFILFLILIVFSNKAIINNKKILLQDDNSNKLFYKINDSFIKNHFNYNNIYTNSYNMLNNKCNINIEYTNKFYTNTDNFLKERIYYYTDPKTYYIDTKSTNDIIWKYSKINNNIFYSIKYNNYYYLIHFSNYNLKLCKKEYKKIENSFSFH